MEQKEKSFSKEDIETLKAKYKDIYLMNLAWTDGDDISHNIDIIARNPNVSDIEEYAKMVQDGKSISANKNLFYKLVVSDNKKEAIDEIGICISVYAQFIQSIQEITGEAKKIDKKKL